MRPPSFLLAFLKVTFGLATQDNNILRALNPQLVATTFDSLKKVHIWRILSSMGRYGDNLFSTVLSNASWATGCFNNEVYAIFSKSSTEWPQRFDMSTHVCLMPLATLALNLVFMTDVINGTSVADAVDDGVISAGL